MKRKPKTHHLKCWPEFFLPLRSGKKGFELRLNDRDFRPGDTLVEYEYDPHNGGFTKRKPFRLKVGYVLYGPAFGLSGVYCIMSVKRI